MNKTTIEWTDSSWNPITGCTQISNGCKNCYAKRMAKRLFAMKNPRYLNNFKPTFHEDLLDRPLKIKDSNIIFVCSMSDLFHEDIKFEIIDKVFDTMNKANWHTFQVLTKRSKRLKEYADTRNIPDNVWVGVTVENSNSLYRVDDIREINASVKFLSCEPLLESISSINLKGIDWVVVGGESGPKSRPIEEKWVLEVKEKCEEEEVKFFFKQWGGFRKKEAGRLLEGKIYDDMPEIDTRLSSLIK